MPGALATVNLMTLLKSKRYGKARRWWLSICAAKHLGGAQNGLHDPSQGEREGQNLGTGCLSCAQDSAPP